MNGRLALNEDNSHYYFTRSGLPLTKSDVSAFVDQYANTQVQQLLFSVNCMKTSFASKVWEPIWKGYDPAQGEEQALFVSVPQAEKDAGLKWIRTAWQLAENGIDPYELWIARCREIGISPWISIRMNDVHSVNDESHYLHNELWRTRKDLRRVPYKCDQWVDKAFDYGKPEVRAHHLALIKEVIEKYDCDGVELDWMRFGFHFRPGFEDEGAIILTDFIAEIRKLLDEWEVKRGHAIKLSARVPSRPESALALGMNTVQWAERGLIDQLVITPFWETVDSDMPIEIWKQLLKGTSVTLAAGLELLVRPYPESQLRQKNTLESARGAAMSYLRRGADIIYLFNYMDSLTSIENTKHYPILLNELGSLETIRGKCRRHIVTYADTWAPGAPRARILPLRCSAAKYSGIRIDIGERPLGQQTKVLLSFDGLETLASDDCKVLVNGQPCQWLGPQRVPVPSPEGHLFGFLIPELALKQGGHVIEIKPKQDMTVTWAEIFIMEHLS